MLVCCEARYLLSSLPDEYADLILTDIPYNEVNRPSNGLRNLNKGIADILEINLDWLAWQFSRVVKGSCYIFCGIDQAGTLIKGFKQHNLSSRLCFWQKTNPSPINGQHTWLSATECCVFAKKPGGVFKEFCKPNVWKYPTIKNVEHPTPKPIELFKYLIETSSNVGDLVLDPFCGSGTTAIAAKLAGRKYLCSDYFLNYCKLTNNRVQHLGDKV